MLDFHIYILSFFWSLTIYWGFLPRTPRFSLDNLLKHLPSHLRFHYRYLQETQMRQDINIYNTERTSWKKNQRQEFGFFLFRLEDVSFLVPSSKLNATKPVHSTGSNGLRGVWEPVQCLHFPLLLLSRFVVLRGRQEVISTVNHLCLDAAALIDCLGCPDAGKMN